MLERSKVLLNHNEYQKHCVPDVEYHLNVVRKAASNMMRLLAYSPDIGEVARLLMPDFDDWRWSEGERNAAKELWRL